MTLIKSISGIRGTIGGKAGQSLTPIDIVKFTSSYIAWVKTNQAKAKKIVVGRDGRISGEMLRNIVVSTIQSLGLDVIDLGLSTTPTVEMAVKFAQADGGIILTASHNPREWNALKLLNHKGEFISAEDGQWILNHAENEQVDYSSIDHLGTLHSDNNFMQEHIDAIVNHPLVDKAAIEKRNFKIVIDPINSTGATFVPALLSALGVKQIELINDTVNGEFAHNPELSTRGTTRIATTS
jgi:phosphomannomutase